MGGHLISNVSLAICLAGVAGIADLLGGLMTVVRLRATRRSILYSTALAAGFIVAAAILDRVPEAFTPTNPNGPYFILIGFLLIYLVENLFSTHAHAHDEALPPSQETCDSEHGHAHALVSQFQPEECHISASAATTAFVGLLLHTLLDGIAIAAGFLTSHHTGMVMFLAVIFHKMPEGFSVSALMLASGRTALSAVTSAGMLGVATLAGAVLASAVGTLDARWTQTFLTLATGSFLYIGCSDMIPATNKGHDRWAVLLVLIGVALFIISTETLEAAGLGH